jgi:hypothetical protein
LGIGGVGVGEVGVGDLGVGGFGVGGLAVGVYWVRNRHRGLSRAIALHVAKS